MAKTPRSAPPAVADRLLKGSVRRWYQPEVAIDWDAPLVDDKYFYPPTAISLYGTPYWNELTEAQRIELSRHELANALSVALWFENFLNRSLLLWLMSEDPTGSPAHYALTEMADECRHMTMFGKVIARVGARPSRLSLLGRMISASSPHFMRGSLLWVTALAGEEIFDAVQRRGMVEDDLQPLVRQMMRIHVTEEARHVRYAREGIVHHGQSLGFLERVLTANLIGVGGPLYRAMFTSRQIYANAGLDPRRAQREARRNRAFRASNVDGFASLAAFLQDQRLLGPVGRLLWRRAGYLP